MKRDKKYLGESQSATKFDSILGTMQNWQVNICCLAGTDAAWDHRAVRKATQGVVKKRMGRCAGMVTSTSGVYSASNVKFGGTAICLDNMWATRMKQGEDDSGLGRWSYAELEGRKGKKVLIVTAYRPCSMKVEKSGAKTAIAQQYAMLREQGYKNPDPRNQFIIDLRGFLRNKMKEMEVVVLLDANKE